MAADEVTLTIVYDNNRVNSALAAGWGFSCLIEASGKTILFDTGDNGPGLLHNLNVLEINPADTDAIVLSHFHRDHFGGLSDFLETYNQVTVYIPSFFPERLKDGIMAFGARVSEVSGPEPVVPGAVYSTGILGRRNGIIEQALAVKTGDGLAVITGCAHPGVVNVLRASRQITGEPRINLALGGFHLFGLPSAEIKSVIEDFRKLSVQKPAPCHCSGDDARRLFKQAYGKNYLEAGAGTILKFTGSGL